MSRATPRFFSPDAWSRPATEGEGAGSSDSRGFGLRPGILADRQLDQALHGLAEDFQEKSGVVIVVDVDPRIAAEPSSRATDVVRVVREALNHRLEARRRFWWRWAVVASPSQPRVR